MRILCEKISVNVGDDLPKAHPEGELSAKLTERVCEILCFWSLGGRGRRFSTISGRFSAAGGKNGHFWGGKGRFFAISGDS